MFSYNLICRILYSDLFHLDRCVLSEPGLSVVFRRANNGPFPVETDNYSTSAVQQELNVCNFLKHFPL